MHSPAWVFWLYFVTLLPWLACLVIYASRAPWRNRDRSVRRTAWAQFTSYAALSAVLGYASVVRFFSPSRSELVALTFVFIGGVCLAGCAQLINVVRLIWKGSRRDRAQ